MTIKYFLFFILSTLCGQLMGCAAPTTQPPITEKHEIIREEKIQSELTR